MCEIPGSSLSVVGPRAIVHQPKPIALKQSFRAARVIGNRLDPASAPPLVRQRTDTVHMRMLSCLTTQLHGD